MHVLILYHFLAKIVYTQEFWKKKNSKFFHNKVTTLLFEGFKQKEKLSM